MNLFTCLNLSIRNDLSVSFYSVYLSSLSVCLPAYLSVRLSVCLPAFLPAYLSVCLSVCLFVRPSVCLSVCLPAYLSACQPASLSVCLSVCLCPPVCLSVSFTILKAKIRLEWPFSIGRAIVINLNQKAPDFTPFFPFQVRRKFVNDNLESLISQAN